MAGTITGTMTQKPGKACKHRTAEITRDGGKLRAVCRECGFDLIKTKTKRHKYGVCGADERTIDGIVFHSKKEAGRYQELRILERTGEIKELSLQPEFSFDVVYSVPTSERTVSKRMRYIGDFKYSLRGETRVVIEDSKGVKTAEFKRKAKLFEKLYPEYKLLIT